jgi:glycosyltransferase involved in cell wall biosynthesis
MNVLFLTRYGQMGSSSRMRCFQYLNSLEQAGIKCNVVPLITDSQLTRRYQKGSYRLSDLLEAYGRRIFTLLKRKHFDLLWIEKEALPWLPKFFESFLLKGISYILDFDDAIFHNYDLHPSLLVRHFFGRRVDQLIADSCLVVAGNQYLAQRASDAGAPQVKIIPTVIDLNKYPIQPISSSNETLCIVWIGSPSTVRYLSLLREPLAVLAQKFTFKFRIIGWESVHLPGVNVEFISWSEQSEVSAIQSANIGVMPLFDEPWERGKCGYKLIQYMACGLPVVASPVGVNTEIVCQGVNGFLAQTADDWVNSLANLMSDSLARLKMGNAGRKMVEEKYCLQQTAPRLVALLNSVIINSN